MEHTRRVIMVIVPCQAESCSHGRSECLGSCVESLQMYTWNQARLLMKQKLIRKRRKDCSTAAAARRMITVALPYTICSEYWPYRAELAKWKNLSLGPIV